ncbi:MAG: hypothetical protein KAS32_14545 [Candidatus Peribacteraceae bacterium]|nr:hypothetical protein [Candidatus Peribacteraceae bacterium]
MIITQNTEITINLQLTRKEACWLKTIMQNPLYGSDIENEPPDMNSMRRTFWDALVAVEEL